MVMESLQRLDPPRTLGKWTLLAKLGEGGMASVYIAAVGAGRLQRLCAVKLLRANAPDHDYRTRFMDEAAVVVRLHHNNLVDVREAGEVDGQLFIAMELIEGRDLADVWDRCAEVGRAFPVPMAVYVVREILRGLHYAHTFPGLSLVHRDVSPSNVLLDWAGAVRLADFGLATSTLKAADTVPGMVFGKVGYMAPEQAVRGKLDGRADVYGCGVVLWELLTGRPLRESGTNTQAVANWDAPKPSSRSSRVDAELDAIVTKALQRDREARYPSAAALLGELSRWLTKHAPDTTQEVVSEFMLSLFADARKADHTKHEELLAIARARALQAPVAPPGDRPGTDTGAPVKKTGIAARISDLESISAGTIVADRYRIESPIGVGGMGTVYLAEHVTVGRKVAVKVLTFEFSQHQTVARRFKEEARAASAAGHPNIVEVFDAGTLPDGRLFLVMEHLTGRSLYDEISSEAPFPILRACQVIRDVARAIRAAHGVGIIHRDLKPDNIMLSRRGEEERIKVLDFGISASADRTEEEARLTLPGHALGTPEYMAPEQARGKPPSERFDVYALGVILFEMLAGRPPFQSDNIVEVLARKAVDPPPPLRSIRPEVPPDLAALCEACLATDPDQRLATADAFIRRLDSVVVSMLGPGEVDSMSSTLSGPTSGIAAGLAAAAMRDAAAPTAARGPGWSGPEEDTDGSGNNLPRPPTPAQFDAALGSMASRPHEAALTTPVDLDRDSLPPASAGRGEGKRVNPLVFVGVAVGVIGLAVAGGLFLIGPDDEGDDEPAVATRSKKAETAPEPAPEPESEPKSGPVIPADDAAADDAAANGPAADGEQPAADEAGDASPEPEPAAKDPEPEPEPDPEPSSSSSSKSHGSDAADSARCERVRKDATSYHDSRKWDQAISQLNKSECWSGGDRAKRKKMLVKALFETRQWKRCAKVGRGASDGATKAYAEGCRERQALEEG